MKKSVPWLFVSLVLLFSTPELAFADCQGCCSRRGGVVCSGGVTRCKDCLFLSAKYRGWCTLEKEVRV